MIIDSQPESVRTERRGCKLTAAGIIWTSLSLAAAILNCAGYYVPYWLKGSFHNAIDVSFGSFRRCNYPRLTDEGKVEIVIECGRYRTFGDIPSLSWQITTILIGMGSSTSLLVAFTVLASCCLSDVITKSTAKALGVIQLIGAILMLSGGILYPYGWTSPEVRDACGGLSDVYKLGTCQLSWSSYMMISGVVLLFICFVLSFKASKVKLRPYRP